MNLIDLIITIFQTRWNDKLFSNVYNKYTKFSSFITDVFIYMYIIDQLQKEYDTKLKFAIWGNNSCSYIATFIALILKNVDIYVIPFAATKAEISSIIVSSNINVLFAYHNTNTVKEISNKLSILPYFKSIITMSDYNIIYSESKTLYDNISPDLINIIGSSKYDISNLRNIIFTDFKVSKRDRDIVMFTDGTTNLYPHSVYFSDTSIVEAILKIDDSGLLPNLNNKVVFSDIPFSEAIIWTILWPLYSNAIFAFSINEADILISNTKKFESLWNIASKSIYDTAFIGKLLFKDIFSFLFNFLIKRHMKNDLNYGKKKEAVIVLNSTLSPRIIKTLRDSIPLYTTYGIQETNQIIAINNYSSYNHCLDNCVGEVFDGISIDVRANDLGVHGEGSLVIATPLLATSVEKEKDTYYDTRDHGSLMHYKNRTLVFVYGKMQNIVKNTVKTNNNYETIERILKNIPYFKDVLFYKYGEDYYLMIYPNLEIIQSYGFDLIDFKNYIKQYRSILNDTFDVDFIKEIKIMMKDFGRTYSGNIKRIFYTQSLDVI